MLKKLWNLVLSCCNKIVPRKGAEKILLKKIPAQNSCIVIHRKNINCRILLPKNFDHDAYKPVYKVTICKKSIKTTEICYRVPVLPRRTVKSNQNLTM